jgi:hypothetical protein
MAMGVIFIVVEIAGYVDDALNGDCLTRKAAEARRVDVMKLVRRGWWRRRRGIMGDKVNFHGGN